MTLLDFCTIQNRNEPIKRKKYPITHFYIKLPDEGNKKETEKKMYIYIHRSIKIYFVDFEQKLSQI